MLLVLVVLVELIVVVLVLLVELRVVVLDVLVELKVVVAAMASKNGCRSFGGQVCWIS